MDQSKQAFLQLKRSLTNAPVLDYADPSKLYVLHVNASGDGMGGILYQQHDGHMQPVSYCMRVEVRPLPKETTSLTS